MGEVRDSMVGKSGITFDVPLWPAWRLVDDLSKTIVKIESVTLDLLGPIHYGYRIDDYPDSHHCG